MLVRFDNVAHRLVAGHDAARVAADTGYADQSHLHRDVKAFTGATPATVAGERFLAVDDIAWPSHATPAKPHFSRIPGGGGNATGDPLRRGRWAATTDPVDRR
jgi:AraC-like DNA-binding protein